LDFSDQLNGLFAKNNGNFPKRSGSLGFQRNRQVQKINIKSNCQTGRNIHSAIKYIICHKNRGVTAKFIFLYIFILTGKTYSRFSTIPVDPFDRLCFAFVGFTNSDSRFYTTGFYVVS